MGKKPGPMRVAQPTDKAWIPGIGVVSVAELGEKLRQEREKGMGLFEKDEMIKEILGDLKELAVGGVKGTFTAKMYKEVNAKFKEKHGRRVGISKNNLMRKGFIARAKFPGFPPLFFITQAGAEFLGEKAAVVPTPEEAPSAAEEALKAIAEK